MSDNPTPPPGSPNEEAMDAEDIERELRATLPAIFIDTWSTLTWRGHVRISIGERLYKRDVYRSAFVMDLEDAEDFAEHLLKVIRRRRQREEKLAKDQPSEGES
jgi:hypothetical protein